MGQQYSPLANMNQFTGQMGIAGLNNMAALNRQMAQIGSQEMMDANRLREGARVSNLTQALAERRFDMEMQDKEFGHLRDIETFKQNEKRYSDDLWAKIYAADAPDRAEDRVRTQGETDADAEWDILLEELTTAKLGMDEVKDANRIKAYDQWISKLQGWRKSKNAASYLRAFKASKTSNPTFGLVRAGLAASKEKTSQDEGYEGF